MQSPEAEKLEALFHEAAELPPAERDRFLARADPELARRVREMLSGAADPTWEQSALELEARQTAIDIHPARPGEMFGPYRIVRRIGAGGMALVYEAVRDDDEFHKRVAIKFVQTSIDNDAGVERFRAERQILAPLEHPNIARLLDGGTTAEGLPYLVMEYVDGLPVDRFAAERRLSRTQRLKLFLQVCDAVQYAHHNLVVHRDLKPANILVTDDGTAKLLDFGIAKLMKEGVGSQTVAALTPEFASPEQVLGRGAGTASDIYSLGVLLFLLLAERLPYGACSSAGELVRAICERDPIWAPPGMIDRDLQSVIAQALRKEPEKRYRSVEQFIADLRSYLEGRPVAARSGAWLYRAGKFVRRRAISLAAAAAVVIAISAGVAATVTESRRVERRFNEVRALAHSVLFDVYDALKTLPGSLPARRLVAGKAQQYLDSLSRDADDPSLVRDLAESYLRLGDVRGGPYGANLGDTPGALESYRKAQTLLESAVAQHPRETDLQMEVAQTYLSLGRVLMRQNLIDDALAILQRPVRIMSVLVDRFPQNITYRERLARSYQGLSEAQSAAADRHHSVEESQLALAYARKAVAIQEAAGSQSGEEWQISLASKYAAVAYRLQYLAQFTGDRSYAREAVEAHEKAVAISRALAAARPGEPHRQLADGLLSAGQSRWECCRDFAGAVADIREALGYFERLAKTEQENLEARRDLANVYQALGFVMGESGRIAEALEADRQSVAIREDLSRADATDEENLRHLKNTRLRMSILQVRRQ